MRETYSPFPSNPECHAQRLCSGSLTNLAKYPASTVQILGAEKALFRALKTKGNTPKVRFVDERPFACSS